MAQFKRSPFQQEVVQAILDSNAIDLEAMGSIFGRLGKQAVLEGESRVNIIHRDCFINCGWPLPEIGRFQQLDDQFKQ